MMKSPIPCRKVYKFRLEPTELEALELERTASVARYAYNWLRPEKLLEFDCLTRRESIRPSVPSDVAYEVERRGNEPFEALGQCTHARKSGTRPARGRCICQHKAERA